MRSEYVNAVESRLRWLRWAKTPGAMDFWLSSLGAHKAMLPAAVSILESGESFFMDARFQELVAHARLEVPDALAFDPAWVLAPRGFMWLDVPFLLPRPDAGGDGLGEARARAIGWRQVTADVPVMDDGDAEQTVQKECTQFVVFTEIPEVGGFGCWSYMLLYPHVALAERMRTFEAERPDTYAERDLVQHELRWIYAAFHLMAQRLTVVAPEAVDRATRRRAQHSGESVPPILKVVMLRRFHVEQGDPGPSSVEWQWQWMVVGHWRNQWFPSEGKHKPVFVDAYMKGPGDKPMKPTSIRLYVAAR